MSIQTCLGTFQTMHDFTIIALTGQYPTGIAVTQDMLSAAAHLAPRFGLTPPRWKVYSPSGGRIDLLGGLSIETSMLPTRGNKDSSTWIISGMSLTKAEDVDRRLHDDDLLQLTKQLKAHIKRGGKIAASCSAVFALQAADLLNGRRATTTWWLSPLLQTLAPQCRVDADRMVCVDGPIVTSGAAFAQTDMLLYLLRDAYGNELVDAVCRVLLIDNRVAQQASFIVPEFFASGDELLSRIIEKIDQSIPDVPSVKQLADDLCMTERTLLRHVQQTTGKSTAALIQRIRFRHARTLLENSRLTVEQIAEAVGYKDATALRKMVKKVTGTSPRHSLKTKK